MNLKILIAAIPLEPRLAHMLIEARERGIASAAAETAVLLTERFPGLQAEVLELPGVAAVARELVAAAGAPVENRIRT